MQESLLQVLTGREINRNKNYDSTYYHNHLFSTCLYKALRKWLLWILSLRKLQSHELGVNKNVCVIMQLWYENYLIMQFNNIFPYLLRNTHIPFKTIASSSWQWSLVMMVTLGIRPTSDILTWDN